ncbi:hypothetical protein Vc3S01_p20205 (plasmid) [Vibrio campbellii]|uniref:hypothetical protein n=1 Tax=Vibrio campbellii TaxID=680 RepID=UPI000A2FCDB5|nr:hypothetical protein [Vibrio campbellii]ARR10320.1 hypothetical protein Vc3S01_p20205 [Vibrio campbellii]
MNTHRLTAAESHELACRVSALGAKQVLELLRIIQNHTFDSSSKRKDTSLSSSH